MKRSAFAVVALAVLAGCGGGGGTGTGGGSGGGGGTGGGGGQALDCPGLVSCTSNCADMDQACLNACGAQTTNDVIAVYNALVDCTNAHSCTTGECVQQNCANELNACVGSSGTGGGAGGGGGSVGLTTSGKCEISATLPNNTMIRTCWDYSLTVSTNHNDGTEHYVYYDSTTVTSGQSACTDSTFSAQQPGPWDNASISARNLSQKKTACALQAQGGASAVFTEGATCSLSGSLGHCTWTVTNVWDPGTTTLTATVGTMWAVP